MAIPETNLTDHPHPTHPPARHNPPAPAAAPAPAAEGSAGKTKMSEGKRVNRALTQKYDMHQLRALQKLEEDFMGLICPIYGCDEDTLPVVVDLLKIFNEPSDQRRGHLIELLKSAPKDVTDIVNHVTAEFTRIEAEHQVHEQEHEAKAGGGK